MTTMVIPPGLRFFFIQGGVSGPGLLVFVRAVGGDGGDVGLRVWRGEAGARRRGEAGAGNGPGQGFPHLCWHRAPHLCNKDKSQGTYIQTNKWEEIIKKNNCRWDLENDSEKEVTLILTYHRGIQNQFI